MAVIVQLNPEWSNKNKSALSILIDDKFDDT